MGGRGSYAAGNNVEYTYKTVGMVDGVKILQGIGNKHGLPESSHSSEAYIKLKPDGTFHEMRFYNKEHCFVYGNSISSRTGFDRESTYSDFALPFV